MSMRTRYFAGVTGASISRVLKGAGGKRPPAEIPQRKSSENQAVPNLEIGRGALLGLIISDIRNPFFPEITASFQDQDLLHNMEALVLNTNYDARRALDSVKRLIELQVPALAILTSQIEPRVIDMLAESGVAGVYLDLGRVDKRISSVVLDYEQGIAEALEHLTSLGHRQIAYISGPADLHSAKLRKKVFLECAARRGIDSSMMVDSDFTVKGGYYATSRLLEMRAPTAIVCGNDLTAIGVLRRASDGGMKVPRDLYWRLYMLAWE